MQKNFFKSQLNKSVSLILIILCLAISFPATTIGANFEVDVTRTFKVDNSGTKIKIKEERVITNNTVNYYIPSSTKETFLIQNFKEGFDSEEQQTKLNSIKVTNGNGQQMDYSQEIKGKNIEIQVPYPNNIRSKEDLTLILEYETEELIETIGKVHNIYIPGLEDNYERIISDDSRGLTQEIIYNTELIVPNEIETTSFTVPEPTSTTEQNGNTILTFDTESILGKSIWHQVGDSQIYTFKITQPTIQTDTFTPEEFGFLSKNKYQLILPREYEETNQKVYFTEINPRPRTIKRDPEGNLVASFLIDATKESEINIEGFMTLEIENAGDNRTAIPKEIQVSAIQNHSNMNKYLQASEYWEVDNPAIQEKAKELAGDSTNIIDILQNDYDFIVESIDYNKFEYGDRKERQGAVATLQGGNSVCMEYSDLLITLLRAQGIPARAAYGYGYDPQLPPDNQESHQWVQAWIPTYGWLTIDPTWGETGRDFIGKDLDHALWYVASKHPNQPVPLEVTSSLSNFQIEESTIEIKATQEQPQISQAETSTELLDQIPSTQESLDEFSEKIQISPVGKSLIILTPSCVFILIFAFLLNILLKILKSKKQTSTTVYNN
jgi:transglutaminase-like putative cysteine protease